jgi:hypothetical protein
VSAKLGWSASALIAIATWLAPSAEAGDRLYVRLDQPFSIAGETFDGGTLSVRSVHTFSPVATLEEICVDGRCVGLFASHEVSGEPASHDALVFTRDASGVLVLSGFAFEGEPERDIANAAPPVPVPSADGLVSEVRLVK